MAEPLLLPHGRPGVSSSFREPVGEEGGYPLAEGGCPAGVGGGAGATRAGGQARGVVRGAGFLAEADGAEEGCPLWVEVGEGGCRGVRASLRGIWLAPGRPLPERRT
jgi:hypothetical protein